MKSAGCLLGKGGDWFALGNVCYAEGAVVLLVVCPRLVLMPKENTTNGLLEFLEPPLEDNCQ